MLKIENFFGLGESSENLTRKNIDSKTHKSKISELYYDVLRVLKNSDFTEILINFGIFW